MLNFLKLQRLFLTPLFLLGAVIQTDAQEFPTGCNLGRNSIQAGFAIADESGALLASAREVSRGEGVRIVVQTALNDLNDCAFGLGGFKAVINRSGKVVYGFTHGDTLPLVVHTPEWSMPSFRGLSNSIKIEDSDVEFCSEIQRECVKITYYLGATRDAYELPGMVTLTDPVNASSWSGGFTLVVKPAANVNDEVNEVPPDGDLKPTRAERRLLKQIAAIEARIKKIRERQKVRFNS